MVELKKRIREALAAERITEKEADIAAWTAGEKTIINITIKAPDVSASRAKEIIDKMSGKLTVFARYSENAFDEVIKPILPAAQKVYRADEWDGKTIAKNDVSELICTKRLIGAGITQRSGNGEVTTVIYSAEQMAALIWRFKKTGTISA